MSEVSEGATNSVAAAWVRYQATASGNDWWAIDAVHDLIETDLETAWSTLRALCEATDRQEYLCDIGAGPLEDMIYRYGSDAIERLDAFMDYRLLEAACCVWLKRDANLESKLDSVLSARGRVRH